MKITAEEWRERKRERVRERNQNNYIKRQATKTIIVSTNDDATRQRKHRNLYRRQKEVEQRNTEGNRNRQRQFKLNRKQRSTECGAEQALHGVFNNKMSKSRAMKKLKAAMPSTPRKRTALISSYLSSTKSPTVNALQKMKVVVTPDEKSEMELAKAVLTDLTNAVEKTKIRRSDDARAAINIITASVSGEAIESNNQKAKLARKLGLPRRRVSGGQRVRATVLTSEKSCWTYTNRKTRHDALSENTKKLVYDFWMAPDNSRPSPNKADVKRVRIGVKQYSKHSEYILENSQTEIYLEFTRSNPNIKIGQRCFERLKPYFVREARTKDRQTCCCRYHVEAKSLFRTCMDFRRRHAPSGADNASVTYPVYEHLSDAVATTLCEKQSGSDVYNKSCLDRTCVSCGVSGFKLSPEELNTAESAPNVKWERYEYVSMRDKQKLTLVRKITKPAEMFEYFKEVLKTFPSHQFRASWQNAQLKHLLENLPHQHCVAIHDFSENYGCKEKTEIQSTYFQRTEVSIHVTILHRHAVLEYDGIESTPDNPTIVTEHFFVISPDEKHDQHFTHQVQVLVSDYLKSISLEVKVMHEFTDGCQCQYKSRHCMGDVSESCSELGYDTLIRNFFETSHAKGPQDAAGGYLKNQIDLAVLRGNEVVQSAADLFQYANKKLQTTKSLSCKRRIFRYVESIPRDSKPDYPAVPGNRKIHQIRAEKIKPGQFLKRNLSCYSCDNCSHGDYDACTNFPITGECENFNVRNQDLACANDVDMSDTDVTAPRMADLVSKDTVVAVLAEDPDCDYFLLQADSTPFILDTETHDAWGNTFPAGVKVVKGLYFDKLHRKRGQTRYRLLRKKTAIVLVETLLFICSELSIITSKGDADLTDDTHLDILSVIEEIAL